MQVLTAEADCWAQGGRGLLRRWRAIVGQAGGSALGQAVVVFKGDCELLLARQLNALQQLDLLLVGMSKESASWRSL